jgi:hypothetical protein
VRFLEAAKTARPGACDAPVTGQRDVRLSTRPTACGQIRPVRPRGLATAGARAHQVDGRAGPAAPS